MKKIYILILTLSFILTESLTSQLLEMNAEQNKRIEAGKEYDSLNKKIQENSTLIEVLKDVKEEADNDSKKEDKALSIVANLTNSFNNIIPNPTFLLRGKYVLEQKGHKDKIWLLLSLSTSSLSNSDTSIEISRKNIFLNEMSVYTLGLSFAYKTNDNLALSGLFNYSGKNVTKIRDSVNTKENEDFGVIHLKGGVEYAPAKNISFFANVNYLITATKINEFEKLFPDKEKNYSFFEAGINGLIPSISNDTFIDLGFRVIFLSSQMKDLIGNQDKFIPVITIGIKTKIAESKKEK